MFKDKMVYFYLRKISNFVQNFTNYCSTAVLICEQNEGTLFLDLFNNDEPTPEYPNPFNAN